MKIKVGYIYRAKNPSPIDLERSYYDDRQVVWIGYDLVYYDSPGLIRRVNICTLEEFDNWAGWNVSSDLPKNEWAEFDFFNYSRSKWMLRIKNIIIYSNKGTTIIQKRVTKEFNNREEFDKYHYRIYSAFYHKYGDVKIILIFDEK